ncbi:MAG: ECF transporter S component [Clostridiales bacterium]|nr:ECF transporter S component [Clostridiales bacterium]
MNIRKNFPVSIFVFIAVLLSLVLTVVWQIFASDKNYYIICVIMLILSMLPFFTSFERSNNSAREITLIASLVALAVISRAVFYMIPQVKPIAAVIAVSGASLGAKRGYLIGTFSAFISNFIFGQGIWTPFQMVGMGLVGLICGLIFYNKKVNRIALTAVGFITVFIVYGITVDTSSVLIMATDYNLKSVLAVYIAGIPYNLVFGISTGVFLFIFGLPFMKKINRINEKYGICIPQTEDNYG